MSDKIPPGYEEFTTFVNLPACSIVQELPYSQRCHYVSTALECRNETYVINYLYILYCIIEPENDTQQLCGALAMLSFCIIQFVILAAATDRFFCPSLKVVSKLLGLSEHLAGITLLAFGNGAPDLLTSLTSMHNPSRMMFSDLFGAGIFVTSVVGGTICILEPFKMAPISLLRDGCFYIFSCVYIDYIINSDYHVTILESIGVLSIYVFYILTNFVDQHLLKRNIKYMELKVSDKRYATEENFKKLQALRDEVGMDLKDSRSHTSINPALTRDLGYEERSSPNSNLFKQFISSINPFDKSEWEGSGVFIRSYVLLKVPINLILLLILPVTDYEVQGHGWSKLLNSVQMVSLPTIMMACLFPSGVLAEVPFYVYAFIITLPLSFAMFFTSRTDMPPSYHSGMSFITAIGAIWIISSVAQETVNVFYVLGIVSKFSNAFLGITLLAWGNSIGDMVADVTVSRDGLQKMGFAACYGGPLFNTLMAMGIQMLYKSTKSPEGWWAVPQGPLGENTYVFLALILMSTLTWAVSTNFYARRSVGYFCYILYLLSFLWAILGELEVIQTYEPDIPSAQINAFNWDRSISEPDLTDPSKQLNRFVIKHPYEYISVDDLKFFRRKKPPDLHTQSHIYLYDKNDIVLPFGSLETEYKSHFCHYDLKSRPTLLRRATSLRLEGLMYHKSEHQEQYHWYTPQDWKICRSYPIRNPESLRLTGVIDMDPEYRSSYISYPMVDRATKILPREMFRIEPDHMLKTTTTNFERTDGEVAAINKLAEDKFKRDIAAQEQQKCHLQQRATETNYSTIPSEYRCQFVRFPIEKAHSIPQISHIKMQGEFTGVPEYQDSFKMYANYSKSAPIKKVDNLRISGAEVQDIAVESSSALPEYRDKYANPPKKVMKEKTLRTDDHLHPRGEFSKDVPEYYESFRDPQVKQMPERGKCREPHLRLKGKIEFNPEYRNTYLDFPRSRPITRKPISSLRLPTNSTSSTTTDLNRIQNNSPRRKYKSSSPQRFQKEVTAPSEDITVTPEYRRAHYNYQLRERTPTRKKEESDGGKKFGFASHKSSDSSLEQCAKPTKRRTRNRQNSIMDPQIVQNSLENLGGTTVKKVARFGRRASVLQNAVNCREKSSIIEGNPKYATANTENRDSFVVLDEPCRRSNWMKKSWYDS